MTLIINIQQSPSIQEVFNSGREGNEGFTIVIHAPHTLSKPKMITINKGPPV